jgi:7-cyano-7-deazaguanine synthase
MCSIYGAIGKNLDPKFLEKLRMNAGDRGRDGGRLERYDLEDGYTAYLGAWRARPVHEVANGKLPPYDGVVHNGVIANAESLGLKEGQIDSEILPEILDRRSVTYFAKSLNQIKGSFAIACQTDNTILAAVNYKPLYYWSPNETDVYFSSMERHFHALLPFGVRPAVVEPYSAIDFRKKDIKILPRSEGEPPTALVTASAGLDSTVALADMISKKYQPSLLYFRYGCRAEYKELKAVEAIAKWYGIPFFTMKLDYDQMRGESAIMSKNGEKEIAGVEGMEFAFENVPARNLVLLANATAFAEANGYHYLTLGNNIDEGGSYPDNEEEFTHLLDNVLNYAVKANYKLRIVTPLGHLTKIEIVKKGIKLKVPFHLTYSCYTSDGPCGKCSSCLFRIKAFKSLGYADPLKYKSLPHDFWEDCDYLEYLR